MKVGAKIKTAAISAAINTALGYLEKDPENNAPKLMDMIDKLVPADWYKGQRDAIREAINEKGNWFQLRSTPWIPACGKRSLPTLLPTPA